MNKSSMSSLLQSMEDLEEKIALLKLYDEETYNYFSKRIENVRQGLINLEDDKDLLSANAGPIIEEVAHLEVEIGNFMQNGRVVKEDRNLNSIEDENHSGEEKAKQHAVGVFRELALVVGGMTEIGIERLKLLKTQWEEEKEKYNYSEAECYAIEEALAKAYLEYQIKTCAKEGRVPTEGQDEICSPKFYEKVLKKRVIDYAASLEKGSLERLDLESYCINWKLDTIMHSVAVWKGLSGVEPEFKVEERGGKAENIDASQTPKSKDNSNRNHQNLPLNLNEQARGNAVLVVYEKKMPDGSVQIKKKIKPLDENGRFKLFRNLDRVVELYFLEGTKELKFSKKDDSTIFASHLSEFPNLRNVYLPSTLRHIEQGYFHNCDNLDNVFLANGIYYNPNKQLFPENAKVVEGKEQSEESIVVNEPEEESALFTQVLPTGNHVTIKTHLDYYGLLPKSFVRKGLVGLEEVRYTKGTKRLADNYWTQEYESYNIQGGKYSNIQGLKKVVLPDTCTLVDSGTFQNCAKLEEVELSKGIKFIQPDCFKKCKRLRKINFPEGIKKIDQRAFLECESLTDLSFPESLDAIAAFAFGDCTGLESVRFPRDFHYIGTSAFMNCFKLKDLQLPSKMADICEKAFENCSSLQELCLPTKMEDLQFDSFHGCARLERVLMPRECKSIGYPFTYCDRLKDVVIPTSMREETASAIFSDHPMNIIRTFEMPEGIDPKVYLDREINKFKQEEEERRKKSQEKPIKTETEDKEEQEIETTDEDDIEK